MILSEAKKQQTDLQKEALHLLTIFQIKENLSCLGSVVEVGSYAYSLMVVPDIDFNIYCDDPLVKISNVAEITKHLLQQDSIRKVSVVKNGYDSQPDEGKPKGIWIGIQIIFEDKTWNIDAWLVKKQEADAVPLGFDMATLTQAQKDIILLLKAQLLEVKRYGHKNDYYSAQVYKAVILGNVQTIDDLDRYYQKV